MATDRGARYLPDLDGLRAVAVAAVAWSHWLPAWQFGLPLGAGVHLFFVLSGMLITRILLDLRGAADRGAAVRRFYARRVLRLWPAFYAVLLLVWLAEVPYAATTWPWHAAYLSNLFIAREGQWQGHFSHFWSLAVEQQFYLLWPWLVVWAPLRAVPVVIAATVVLGPLSRLVAASLGVTEGFWALVPGGSADSLGLGALVAWWLWRRGDDVAAARVWPRAAAAGLGGWLLLAFAEALGARLPPAVAVCRQTLQGMVFAWIVWRGVGGFGGAAGRVLRHPWMIAIGAISYGIYLLHPFAPLVLDAVARRVGGTPSLHWPQALRAIVAWGVSVLLATLLWHLVEVPFQRLKPRSRADATRRSVTAGA